MKTAPSSVGAGDEKTRLLVKMSSTTVLGTITPNGRYKYGRAIGPEAPTPGGK